MTDAGAWVPGQAGMADSLPAVAYIWHVAAPRWPFIREILSPWCNRAAGMMGYLLLRPASWRRPQGNREEARCAAVGIGVIVRVLVIEDDTELAEMIAVFLRRRQLAVDVAFDGRGGLDRALFTNYDVVVLDRDLPGLHGDDVCAEIAAAGCRSRVLMLTASASVEDRVDGLDKGADDYLPKPFALAELAARIDRKSVV